MYWYNMYCWRDLLRGTAQDVLVAVLPAPSPEIAQSHVPLTSTPKPAVPFWLVSGVQYGLGSVGGKRVRYAYLWYGFGSSPEPPCLASHTPCRASHSRKPETARIESGLGLAALEDLGLRLRVQSLVPCPTVWSWGRKMSRV
eukprot:1838092-Rhodomonas_salina.1